METYHEENDLFTTERKGDERLAVRFFKKAARDDVASAADGVMRFKEIDYIQIMVPGDRDNIIIRPAGDGDKRRFSRQYEDWQRNEGGEQVVGTPLEMWGRLSLPQIEEMRYIGVRTVEQLAELNDGAMLKMPGAVELKRKAAAFIAAQKEEAPLRKVQAELETRDAQIAEQAAAIEQANYNVAAMQAQINALLAAQAADTKQPQQAKK